MDAIRANWAELGDAILADREFEEKFLHAFAYAPAFIFARHANLAHVARDGASMEELAAALEVDESTARGLVALLSDMGLTDTVEDGVVLTPGGVRLLDPAFATETFEPVVAFLRTVLHGMDRHAQKVALPPPLVWPPVDPESAAAFEPMMTATAPFVATWLDEILPFSRSQRVLDVGGGDGTVAALLCSKWPGLLVHVVNLPSAENLIARTAATVIYPSRIEHIALDFRESDLPRGFDLVMFVRMLSDWDDAVVCALLHQARRSLTDGGEIWAIETSIAPSPHPDMDDTRQHPWAWFWRLCVPGFRLNGPRRIHHWVRLANSASLGVELVEQCGREPIKDHVALRFRPI